MFGLNLLDIMNMDYGLYHTLRQKVRDLEKRQKEVAEELRKKQEREQQRELRK